MESKIEQSGFVGDLKFLLNEEGSGAKIYKNSCYYPDSRINPKTESGVTIDPGVDLANGSLTMVNDVINYYRSLNILSQTQASLLSGAIGLKKFNAINWIKIYESDFKYKFLVPLDVAANVMGNYSSVNYWKSIVNRVPNILNINPDNVKIAIHTAVISLAYNCGVGRAINTISNCINNKNYLDLSDIISSIPEKTNDLRERRKREGDLIKLALDTKQVFKISLDDLSIEPKSFDISDQFDIDIDSTKVQTVNVPEQPNI